MSTGNKYHGLTLIIMMFLALSVFISLASAFAVTDLQWKDGISYKLQRGGVVSYNGYSVEVKTFPAPVESDKYKEVPVEPVDPYVGLNVSKNGSFTNTTVLGMAESYITPDSELKITVNDMPTPYAREWLFESYSPWATIELSPRGTPNLDVSVDTDKSEYSSEDSEITATVRLENTGSADAVNVDMDIKTELSVKRGSLKYHYDRIRKGDSVTETIVFTSPMPTEETKYDITANISGYDVKDIPYPANSTRTILMTIDPESNMILRKSINEKIYLRDTAMVTLSLKNNGKYDIKNVSIDDSLPSSFKLVYNNTPLHWVVDIPAGGEWEQRYLVEPLVPDANGIIFPVATAEFRIKNELYGIRSNQPTIVVYGPKIVLSKKTDISEINPGDTVTVTVTAQNTGSTPARVIIKDKIPQDTTLVSGTTAFEDFVEANKETSFSYTLRLSSNQSTILPAAAAEYYKLGTKGSTISTQSQELEIKIKSAHTTTLTPQIETPVQTPELVPTIDSNNSDNPTNPDINDLNDTASNDTRRQIEPSREISDILNLILGCNDGSANNSRSVSNACNFLMQDKYTG